jgi:hypothetical protein
MTLETMALHVGSSDDWRGDVVIVHLRTVYGTYLLIMEAL